VRRRDKASYIDVDTAYTHQVITITQRCSTQHTQLFWVFFVIVSMRLLSNQYANPSPDNAWILRDKIAYLFIYFIFQPDNKRVCRHVRLNSRWKF